jgi:hypothetical protein
MAIDLQSHSLDALVSSAMPSHSNPPWSTGLDLFLFVSLEVEGISALVTWPRFPLNFRNASRFSLRVRAAAIFNTRLRLSAQLFNARSCFIPISVVFYCADVAPTELLDYYINYTNSAPIVPPQTL